MCMQVKIKILRVINSSVAELSVISEKMSKKWSSELTIKFLEEYEGNPCLWDVSSNDYKNRNLRNAAYSKISKAMNIKGFDCAAVKAKIRSIRNAYTLERTKIVNSRKSGKGTDEIYKPKVAWFPVANRILHDVVQSREAQATIIVTQNDTNTQEETELQCLDEETLSSPTSSVIDDTPNTSSTYGRPISPIATKRTKIDKPTKSIRNEKAVKELQEISKKSETPADDDEFDCFGKCIASHLKKLPERLALESMAHIQSYLVQQRLACCNSNNQHSVVDYNEGNWEEC